MSKAVSVAIIVVSIAAAVAMFVTSIAAGVSTWLTHGEAVFRFEFSNTQYWDQVGQFGVGAFATFMLAGVSIAVACLGRWFAGEIVD